MSGGSVGDELAQFYAAEYERCVRQVRGWGGSAEIAEDVAQEAFLELFRRWDTVRTPQALVTTIAKRMLWRTVERQRREILVDTPLDGYGMNQTADPADRVVARAELRRIGLGLRPEEARPLVALAAGYSLGDYARSERIPIKQVRALVRRARQRIVTKVAPPVSPRPAPQRPALVGAGTKARTLIPVGTSPRYQQRELFDAWDASVAKLSTRRQQVYRLAAAGLPPQDIALHLGISQAAARVHLCHARKLVAALMADPIPAADVPRRLQDMTRAKVTRCQDCNGLGSTIAFDSHEICRLCSGEGTIGVWYARSLSYFTAIGLPPYRGTTDPY